MGNQEQNTSKDIKKNITTMRLDVAMVVRFQDQSLQYVIDKYATLTTNPLIILFDKLIT